MGKKVDIKRIRISEKKYRFLMRCFLTDLTASQATQLALVNRNTANRYYNFFRDLAVEEETRERERYGVHNGAEIDESCLGPKRVRGEKGRGAGRKVIVFGLRKRGGNVYTEVVPDVTKKGATTDNQEYSQVRFRHILGWMETIRRTSHLCVQSQEGKTRG